MGDGHAIHREKKTVEKITNGYLVVDEETYFHLKGDSLFLPLEDHSLKSSLAVTFPEYIHNPTINSLGFDRILLPADGKSHLYLEYNGTPLLQPVFAESYKIILSRLILYFALVIIIVLFLTKLLTLDLKSSYNLTNYLQTPPNFAEKVLCTATLVVLLATYGIWPWLGDNPFRGEINTLFLFIYPGLFLIVQLLAFKGKIPPQFAGLQWRQFPRDTALALVIVLVIAVFSILQFPSNLFSFIEIRFILLRFLFFFLWAAAFELIWRGYIQTTLERLWGRKVGLLVCTLLLTVFSFFPLSHNPGLRGYSAALRSISSSSPEQP